MTPGLLLAFLLFCVTALAFSVYTLIQIKRMQRGTIGGRIKGMGGMTAEELIAPGGPLAPKPHEDNTAEELAEAAKKKPSPKIKAWREIEPNTTDFGLVEFQHLQADLKQEGFAIKQEHLVRLCEIAKPYGKVWLSVVALGDIGLHGVTEKTYSARAESLGYEVLIPAPKPATGDELGGRPNPNPFYYADDRIVIVHGK